MYDSWTFLVTGSLATASSRILVFAVRSASTTASGSGCAMMPWFLIRSSIASALFFWHHASLITLHAAHAFSMIDFKSAGSRFHAALLTINSLAVAVSCQPVV